MNYIAHVNAELKRILGATSRPTVLFGQNVAAGSCLSGVTPGLRTGGNLRVLNTPNIENTLVGAGFGLMMSGVDAIFAMKQQDFLLLGVDQLVNTFNMVRLQPFVGSFTILTVMVDSGWEGPQSRFNNFGDLCSIAHVPGYTITNRHDVTAVLDAHLTRPGFRIIGISQRLFRQDVVTVDEPVVVHGDADFLRYAEGDAATIACFNLSLPQGLALRASLAEQGKKASVFSVNAQIVEDWRPILDDAARTGALVILDDSRSANRACHGLELAVRRALPTVRVTTAERRFDVRDIPPNADLFEPDAKTVGAAVGLF